MTSLYWAIGLFVGMCVLAWLIFLWLIHDDDLHQPQKFRGDR